MPTVLLVHGAWHAAWHFEEVVSRLRSMGLSAVAVDLPGHGDHPGPLTDLHGDAAEVTAAIERIGLDVVLVGHSYGGAVITEAGVHPRVRHLVYLAAIVPDSGESTYDLAWGRSLGLTLPRHEGPPVSFLAEPGISLANPAAAVATFYHRCPPELAAAAIDHLCPQSAGSSAQVPAAVAWRVRPSTYAVCADDRIVDPAVQRVLARRCSESVEWDSDHSPFLCIPDTVAELLAGVARRYGA